jgi:4-hydroxythreonine-4-phosphate dehydrogenase
MSQPRLGITLGDPAGIGPEVIAGAWSSPQLHALCCPLVLGDPHILRRAAALRDRKIEVIEIASADEACPGPTALPCLACVDPSARLVEPGRLDPRGGQAAYEALVAAARLALAGQIDALVTAPLNKASLWAAGHHYPGHTELLAELCGVDDSAMMLYLAPGQGVHGPAGLGVVHVTLHMALRDVFGQLTGEAILAKIRLADQSLRKIKGSAPRLAVCALNPHAGEETLFGDEEPRVIRPAVDQARAQGIDASGPWPADTAMVRGAGGEFDGVIAMYHDQGHIALKLLGMHRAVNVTLGLPIVRTSVAHGTAFDIAWQGVAETTSLLEAVRVASLLARGRIIGQEPRR